MVVLFSVRFLNTVCTLHFVKGSKRKCRTLFLRSKVRNRLILFNSFCLPVGL